MGHCKALWVGHCKARKRQMQAKKGLTRQNDLKLYLQVCSSNKQYYRFAALLSKTTSNSAKYQNQTLTPKPADKKHKFHHI